MAKFQKQKLSEHRAANGERRSRSRESMSGFEKRPRVFTLIHWESVFKVHSLATLAA